MMQELNVDPERVLREMRENGELSERTVNRMAFYGTKKTQFLNRTEDLPYFWQTPFGKIMTQFKSFIYQQFFFLKSVFKNSPSHRDTATRLMTYLASGLVAGEMAAFLPAVVSGKRREKNPILRPIDSLMLAGGLGIPYDMIRTASQGRLSAAEFVMGPSLGAMTRMFGDYGGAFRKSLRAFSEGKDPDWSEIAGQPIRTTMRFVPLIGDPAGRAMFPPERSQFRYINPAKSGGVAEILGFGGEEDAAKRYKESMSEWKKAMRKLDYEAIDGQ